jgi:hypothetical protein
MPEVDTVIAEASFQCQDKFTTERGTQYKFLNGPHSELRLGLKADNLFKPGRFYRVQVIEDPDLNPD